MLMLILLSNLRDERLKLGPPTQRHHLLECHVHSHRHCYGSQAECDRRPIGAGWRSSRVVAVAVSFLMIPVLARFGNDSERDESVA